MFEMNEGLLLPPVTSSSTATTGSIAIAARSCSCVLLKTLGREEVMADAKLNVLVMCNVTFLLQTSFVALLDCQLLYWRRGNASEGKNNWFMGDEHISQTGFRSPKLDPTASVLIYIHHLWQIVCWTLQAIQSRCVFPLSVVKPDRYVWQEC